ncbi:hypothetical protein CPC08DRAFT_820988 [Agrocybe pediades]|nr:hypothetical protein CPC08DRAFT_820988 [Agrocybe pediades]
MGANKEGASSAALPTPTTTRSRTRTSLRRLLAYIALVSAAATLSTILPTPWSVCRAPNASVAHTTTKQTDPASEWKDNIWPLRPPTPWDISTDFAHPRKLEYEVEEGTWLRLDVHPTSGDIVFDMIGDIYCLPGSQALQADSMTHIKARPVLIGVPHDADPHFSPSGDKLAFRSDAELGVDNIWVTEWKGCEDMDLDHVRDSMRAAKLRGQVLEEGVQANSEWRANRLAREGRLNAQRITNETYRFVSDARFHPSGTTVVATKWYTSSRSLGAGEGWQYDVPSVGSSKKHSIEAGSGKRLVGRTLPLGWTTENYEDQQIGPEQFIWKGNDSVIFSKNVVDSSQFTYSKDVHKGIYSIFQRNLTTGQTSLIVDSFPGGASRPELSRDQRTLAFVRRVRDKEALVLKDLTTGSIHNVWYGLDYDASDISAPMGTYPSFAFAPNDDAVIIWASGKIWSVPLATNSRGERIASSTKSPTPIPFKAHIRKMLAETRTGNFDVVGYETQDTQQVTAFKELSVNEEGTKVVFQAAGISFWQEVGKKKSGGKVPIIHEGAPYYSPSFVPGDDDLVIHSRWSDSSLTKFELASIKRNGALEIEGLPLGRYFSPVLCACKGPNRNIAFIKSGGSYLSGDILATADAGLYIGEITLPVGKDTFTGHKVAIKNIRFVPSEIDAEEHVTMRFIDKNKKLLVQRSSRAFIIDLGGEADKSGKPPHTTIATGRMSTELAVSPKASKEGSHVAEGIAIVDFQNVYFVPGKNVKEGESVWSRPANATKGLARVGLDGGHDLTFAGDGKSLFWFLGPYLHSLKLSKLETCSSEIGKDRLTFGISCVKKLLDVQKIVGATYQTDIARLKEQAAKSVQASRGEPTLNADVVVVRNATLLTMHTGDEGQDLITNGSLVIRAGVIEYAGPWVPDRDTIPEDATVIEANGGFVTPGFIDVHAHWNGFLDRYPASSWELETFLAYGVTTLHNPSADNVNGFVERARVESGQMVGPRIFTVGIPIYGGGEAGNYQSIADMDEARSALIRLKAEGGPSSISYKNYNLPSRASRQRLLTVARNISMLCVPEGGMNYDWDLTYIIDGMTTVEHALPIPRLYEDVLNLYALSGTGATPTLLVNYGGTWGEQLVWATEDVPNDPKLRRFIRHDILEALSESTSRPKTSFGLFNTSRSVATMVSKGLLAHVGAHGEPPMGLNYHAEMGFLGQGGLSNYEVIRAATSSGAKTLGMFSSLGSLARGKLADFLVFPPGVDLLEGEISHKTRQLFMVARGGRIWDAETMVEMWPTKGKKQTMPIINAD